VLTEAYSAMWPSAPHRVLASCIEAASAGDSVMVGETSMGGATFGVPRWGVVSPNASTTGEIAAMALYAGQGVGAVNWVGSAGGRRARTGWTKSTDLDSLSRCDRRAHRGRAAVAAGDRTRCAAFAALLYPHAEVVVHELGADRILALWNPFSGRAVGDPSLLEELPAHWREQPMQGPYPKVELDGRPLSAVSAVVPDADGVPRGLLCVNLDRSPFDDVARIFGALFAPTTTPPPSSSNATGASRSPRRSRRTAPSARSRASG
jgi:hypothetical protein